MNSIRKLEFKENLLRICVFVVDIVDVVDVFVTFIILLLMLLLMLLFFSSRHFVFVVDFFVDFVPITI